MLKVLFLSKSYPACYLDANGFKPGSQKLGKSQNLLILILVGFSDKELIVSVSFWFLTKFRSKF